jgi:hypothetical protein
MTYEARMRMATSSPTPCHAARRFQQERRVAAITRQGIIQAIDLNFEIEISTMLTSPGTQCKNQKFAE